MSAAGRNETPAPAASDLAAALGDAGFVRLLARPDGDAVAAIGVLASALSTTGTPFQASVADPYDPMIGATGADYTIAVGELDVTADAAVGEEVAASATAFDVAGELLVSDSPAGDASGPDPILALAGTIAAGEVVPPVIEAAEDAGVERRPGVAVPVTDVADGLAHSTLVHAPFFGDVDAARETLDGLDLPEDGAEEFDEDDWRRIASIVALDGSSAAGTIERAAEAVERTLHPYVGGPFETVGGYADVLDAAARERPGVALSLALGHEGARADTLDAWREHGGATHAALDGGETARYDGLFVVRAKSMPVATVARLSANFRSPEPVALAVADGEAAIHAVDDGDAATALEDGIESVDGTVTGTGDRARARFDTEDWNTTGDNLVAAVREAL